MKTMIAKAMGFAVILSSGSVWAASPDGFITAKTKMSLMTTANVKSTAVHVDTNDGIVTLYGKVTSEDQKQRAEKTASDIDGVRQVKNLLQVVPEVAVDKVARADKEIKEEVEKSLKAEPMLKDSSVSVKSVDKGVVLLSGKATTYTDQLAAVIAADRVKGVRRVASEIEAPAAFGNEDRYVFLTETKTTKTATGPAGKGSEPTSASLKDTRITAAVKMRLLTSPVIPSTDIKVDTDNGLVTLFGIVPTDAAKSAAESEAAKVSDVSRVQNDLQVVPTSQKDAVAANDKDLKEQMKAIYKDRPELKDVSADVKNGVVRLTGTVNNGWDRLSAVRLARSAAGIKSVQDQLTIRDEKSRF